MTIFISADMDTILFYEKPGCVGNSQQKQRLKKEGYPLDVKDLLNTAWEENELRSFFLNKPVYQWFNVSAPDIKSGKINIYHLNEQQAITLMIENPILICRPLLHYKQFKQSGFVSGPVLNALGISLEGEPDLQSCPVADDQHSTPSYMD